MKKVFILFASALLLGLASCGGGTEQYVNGDILKHWYNEDGEYSEDYYLVEYGDGSKTFEAYMEDIDEPSFYREITIERKTEFGTLMTDDEEYSFQYYIDSNGDLAEYINDELNAVYKKVD